MLKKISIDDKELNVFYNKRFEKAYESNTYFAIYKDEKKIVKLFKNPNVIANKVKKIKKLKQRLKNIDYVVTSDAFITDDNKIIGYMMPYISGKNINIETFMSKKEIIIYLKKVAKLLKELHRFNIVLADFHGNIIIDDNDKLYFIDHDNFAIDDLKVDLKNIYLKEYEKYVKKFDRRFDYYLLNIYTISLLKKIYTPYIYTNYCFNPREYNFRDQEIYDIFNNTMHLNKFYNEDLIIDKIDNIKDLKKLRTRIF